MHLRSGGRRVALEFFEVEIEVRERVVLDIAPGPPQRLELGQCGLHPRARGDEAAGHVAQRPLQPLVGEGRRRADGEGRPARAHGATA